MESGQHYMRINPLCRCEIEVMRPSVEARGNLRCFCGAEMKKPSSAPVFRKLDTPHRPSTLSKRKSGEPDHPCSKCLDSPSQRFAPFMEQHCFTMPPPHTTRTRPFAFSAGPPLSPRESSPPC